MARSIDRLLAKKGWSGEEVGKALIASVIHDAKHMGEPDHKPLFSQADFDRMESSLNNEHDYNVYGVYRSLYSAIVDSYNRGQGLFQQFYNGYSRYSNVLTTCMQTDKALKQADAHPLIVTQEQYNRYRDAETEQRKSFTESFISLLFAMLSSYVADSSTAPEHIRELIDATKEEPATNQRILSNYNENHGEGYYQLPDGRRSDKLSSEEWERALADHYIKNYSYFVDGRKATPDETVAQKRQQDKVTAYRLLYHGIEGIKDLYRERKGKELEIEPDEEPLYLQAIEDYLGVAGTMEAQHKQLRQAPIWRDKYALIEELIEGIEPVVWYYYSDPPELSKYDLLENSLDEYNGTSTEDVAEIRAQYKEFKADYPALSSAMEAYIKETVEPLRSFKPTQYYKDAITWGELAELGIDKYKELVEGDINRFAIGEIIDQETEDETPADRYRKYRQYRRAENGIAIISDPLPSQVDANGDYIEPESPLVYFDSLDEVAESQLEREYIIAYQENLLKPALRFLYAHNALMLIVGSVYGIDDMEAMQLSTALFESQIEGFNGLLYLFYGTVYGDKEEAERKRKLIKEVFNPIDIEELKPSEGAIEAVAVMLKEYGFNSSARKELKNFDKLIARLTREGA